MPFYEYRCNACKHEFEALQKISDKPLLTCPECEQDDLIKLISASAFSLKGTGWYVTDFKDGKKTKPKKETAAPAGDNKTANGSVETKQTKNEGVKSESKSKSD